MFVAAGDANVVFGNCLCNIAVKGDTDRNTVHNYGKFWQPSGGLPMGLAPLHHSVLVLTPRLVPFGMRLLPQYPRLEDFGCVFDGFQSNVLAGLRLGHQQLHCGLQRHLAGNEDISLGSAVQ